MPFVVHYGAQFQMHSNVMLTAFHVEGQLSVSLQSTHKVFCMREYRTIAGYEGFATNIVVS